MRVPYCPKCKSHLPRLIVAATRTQEVETTANLGISGYLGETAVVTYQSTTRETLMVDGPTGNHRALCPLCRTEVEVGKFGWDFDGNGTLVNVDDEMEQLL